MPQRMKWLKNMLLVLTGVLLLWMALRSISLKELTVQLKQANYWLGIPVLLVSLAGYFIRIFRWRILFRSLNEQVSIRSSFIAISAGYLVSYALPRAGEITRCMLVKRYNGVAFSRSLATVIIERITDIICLLLLILTVMLLNVQQMSGFFKENIIVPVTSAFSLPMVLTLGLGLCAGLATLFFYVKRKHVSNTWLDELMLAFKQLLNLKDKPLFVLLTSGIWACYFLMTFIWVYAFPDSSVLPAAQVFVVMIIGTIGKSVPIQGGGMGAYHYLVAQAFLLFGVSSLTGNALAIIIHGAQTVFTLLTGSLAYLMLLYDEKARNLRVNEVN